MASHKNLAEALSAFQASLPTVHKGANGQIPGKKDYKYADLKDISDAVYPKLAEHGLSFIAKPAIHPGTGKFVLAFSLLHVSGDREDGEFELPAGNMQQLGSAITYAKRYSLCAVTGIVPDEDDDGHGAAQASYSRPAVGRGEQPRNGAPQQRNGSQRPTAEQPTEAPGPPKNAAEARAQLAATCKENGWDLGVVAAYFQETTGTALGKATDRDQIVRFRASLFSVSDSKLRSPAEAGAR